MTDTFRLSNAWNRQRAVDAIARAPGGWIVTIREPRRSSEQNDLMWAMLTDISKTKPQGREHTPEVWKNLMMHACGHAVQFEMGLNGQPFPVGLRTSRMSKAEMKDLIDFIGAWGAENGVRFSHDIR